VISNWASSGRLGPPRSCLGRTAPAEEKSELVSLELSADPAILENACTKPASVQTERVC
jgi:hypothetical protein